MVGYKKKVEKFVSILFDRCIEYYGERLVSFVIFGSVARGTYRPDSDIDFLIIAERLPRGRLKRVFEFTKNIEERLEEELVSLQRQNICLNLSPIIKTREEVLAGSPLFLDMTLNAEILYDRENFFKDYLEKLGRKLRELGAKRIVRGNAWYWILKPDYREGDVIDL